MMPNLISWPLTLLILFGGAGGVQALSIDPIFIPFTFSGGAGEFEYVGSSDGTSVLDFQVHVTSGVLDQVRIQIGTDPFYTASTTPGPNVDVSPTDGNVHIFFQMLGGLNAGETSDVFSTTFPNGFPAGTLGSVTFFGGGFTDTAGFEVVPEQAPLLLCGIGLVTLACKRHHSRNRARVPRVRSHRCSGNCASA